MHVDRYARELGLDLAACPFGLDAVVAGVASGKHLDAIAVHLVAFYHLLTGVGGVGDDNLLLGLGRLYLCCLVIRLLLLLLP